MLEYSGSFISICKCWCIVHFGSFDLSCALHSCHDAEALGFTRVAAHATLVQCQSAENERMSQ